MSLPIVTTASLAGTFLSGQVAASDQRFAVGFGSWLQAIIFELGQHEPIDGVLDPSCVLDNGQLGPLGFGQRPVRLPRRPLGDPPPERLNLRRGQRVAGAGRGHALVGVVGADPPDQFARLRVAGHAEAPPVGTVGEDADVSAAGLVLPGRQVVGQLRDRIRQDVSRREVPLDLNQATADLDIDPPADTEAAKTAPVVSTYTYLGSNLTPAETWTSGHRTPYGLAFGPDGRLWEVEHGPRF